MSFEMQARKFKPKMIPNLFQVKITDFLTHVLKRTAVELAEFLKFWHGHAAAQGIDVESLENAFIICKKISKAIETKSLRSLPEDRNLISKSDLNVVIDNFDRFMKIIKQFILYVREQKKGRPENQLIIFNKIELALITINRNLIEHVKEIQKSISSPKKAVQ